MHILLINGNQKKDVEICDDALKSRGAYIVFFSMKENKNIAVGKLGDVFFEAGNYLYMGSAYGKGGLKSRLKRHCQINAIKHWHFDYIRPFATLDKIEAYINGNECELVDKYIRNDKAQSYYKGLGSSDCTKCKSHLLSLKSAIRKKNDLKR